MAGWNSSGCSDYEDEAEDKGTPQDDTSALEEEYKKTYARIKPQIDECCKMAAQAYADAARLAEAHGVPFNTNVIGRRHTYIPHVEDNLREVVNEVTDVWVTSDSDTGWTNSSTSC